MPMMGWLRRMAPVEPKKAASSKANIVTATATPRIFVRRTVILVSLRWLHVGLRAHPSSCSFTRPSDSSHKVESGANAATDG